MRARCSKIFCFAQNRFEAAAAEFTTQFRDDAESAGMIAAFRDFDIRGMFGRGQNARRQIVIKKPEWPGRKHTQLAMHRFQNSLDFASPYYHLPSRHLPHN